MQAELLSTEHGDVAVTPPAALAVHALCAGVGSQPGHRLRSLCDTARIVAATPSAGIEAVDLDAILSRVDRLGVGAVVTHTVETLTAVTGIDADRFGAAVAALPVSAADRRRHAVLVRAARRRGRAHRLRAAWSRRTIGLSSTEAVRIGAEIPHDEMGASVRDDAANRDRSADGQSRWSVPADPCQRLTVTDKALADVLLQLLRPRLT